MAQVWGHLLRRDTRAPILPGRYIHARKETSWAWAHVREGRQDSHVDPVVDEWQGG